MSGQHLSEPIACIQIFTGNTLVNIPARSAPGVGKIAFGQMGKKSADDSKEYPVFGENIPES